MSTRLTTNTQSETKNNWMAMISYLGFTEGKKTRRARKQENKQKGELGTKEMKIWDIQSFGRVNGKPTTWEE